MHQLIATYLFQNKECPLMEYGHLYTNTSSAEAYFLNKQIEAPKQSIHFSTKEINSDSFINYIATQKNIVVENAKEEIKNFIQQLFSSTQNKINGVGIFNKENDVINFQSSTFNNLFSPPAKAERVIHEAAEHTMLVGDKETTTTQMTEYFTDTPVATDKWWIWAIVLGVIGIGVLFFHYFVANQI
jgi:hypothetical protein